MYVPLALSHLPNCTDQMLTSSCYAQMKSRLPDELLAHAKERARAWKPLFQEGGLLSDTPEQIQPAGIEGGTH